ncbi:MerR family transcriptional regulator [Microbispora sitophila]|uniref:MerR family transcriptional regulator n=1 Tax=Microbispora sitophila TaxID=2771537 RepID=UPI00299F74B5|nr:MerR family transcriptional regulator [Microbispora sitophila]
MDDTDALMSIGAFARRVRLAPSALRFYDDCDVLHPAHVDDSTGYRYYSPDQEARAVLVRRLREAGMPLTDASVVLDGTREEALAILEEPPEELGRPRHRPSRRSRRSCVVCRGVRIGPPYDSMGPSWPAPYARSPRRWRPLLRGRSSRYSVVS